MKNFKAFLLSAMVAAIVIILLPISAKASEAYESDGFYYRVSSDGNAVITGEVYREGEKKQEKLTIPSKIDGYTVTAIGDDAFYGASYEEIDIPDTVKRIYSRAFCGNKKLKKIKLPSSVKTVSSDVFRSCSSLAEVTLGNKVHTIEAGAFSNCISLKKINLTDSLKKIHLRAFEKCYKLKKIYLGNKLTKIGDRAFYKANSLKKVTFPKSLGSMGKEAFAKCSALQKAVLPDTGVKLGEGVFRGCMSLKTVKLSKKMKTVPENMFRDCLSLEKMKMPASVTMIKKKAFMNCEGLKTFTLGKKVYAIGDRSFAYSGLERISLNKKLQFIGNGAFLGTNLKKIKLSNRVTYIGNKLFSDCRKLKTVSIPASVKGINPGAFNNCIGLRSIRVAKENKHYCSQDGVLFNKNMTRLIQYPLHKEDEAYTTPATLEKIRARAFEGNRFLKKVTVSAGKIGKYAFSCMTKLSHVTIRPGTVKIADGAFLASRKLKTAELPDSVKEIGVSAFSKTAIKKIHIPASLKSLGSDAFLDCDRMMEFEGGTTPSYRVADGVLYNRKMTTLIQYPARKPGRHFMVPDSVKSICSDAFDGTLNLVKLEMGAKLERLSYRAITGGKRLKYIIFKKKLSDSSAFFGSIECDSLAVIVGPNHYTMRRLAAYANVTLITL